MTLIPGVISPRATKAALIQSLVGYANGNEDEVYPRLLRDFNKGQILAFLPRNCKAKAEANVNNAQAKSVARSPNHSVIGVSDKLTLI